uniref:DnaJ subfamily C member 2 n=1 Tax=Anthurium amnicola TaxID=1678845 RepID=A0A1D1ZHQ0_9ARAE
MGEEESEVSYWSWEDNKLFELALAVVDEGSPARWEAVASIVGSKSAGEVEKHYAILLEDLKSIESGKLDHSFEELLDGEVVCWLEENQRLFGRLDLTDC